jgi:hypothetical protein
MDIPVERKEAPFFIDLVAGEDEVVVELDRLPARKAANLIKGVSEHFMKQR